MTVDILNLPVWIHDRTGNQYKITGEIEIRQPNKSWSPGFKYIRVDTLDGKEYCRTLNDFYANFSRKINNDRL